jgi:hypothetical protein
MERTVHLTALWLTPPILCTTAIFLLPRDPVMSLIAGVCAGFTLGVAFTRWTITRG